MSRPTGNASRASFRHCSSAAAPPPPPSDGSSTWKPGSGGLGATATRAPGSSPQEYAPNATRAVTAIHRNVQLTERFTLFTYELTRGRARGKNGSNFHAHQDFPCAADRAPHGGPVLPPKKAKPQRQKCCRPPPSGYRLNAADR